MATLKDLLIAEATEYEFKEMLETGRPKSWLKSVSAFANCQGGSFYYGVDDVKDTIDKISKLIQARISPLPEFSLKPHRMDGEKTILVLHVPSGEMLPYASGIVEMIW
jgi:ATP-dependent DNA helicase RecG